MSTIYFPRWFEVLTAIDTVCFENRKQNYLERLKRRIIISTSHLKECLRFLESLGLIQRIKQQNRRYIVLTPQGQQAVHEIRRLKELVPVETKVRYDPHLLRS